MSATGSLSFNNLLLRPQKLSHGLACTVALATVFAAGPASSHDEVNLFPNSTGLLELRNTNGRTDEHGAFFQSLGTNGRTCATCHVGDQAMSISPPQIRERYERTNGRDPLFAAVDGANCANVQRSDRRGHSLLLQHGLIRIPINIPATAQFTISVMKDPYGCALVSDPKTGLLTASVYRRPLPTANVNFLSVVMWDGRETVAPLTSSTTFMGNLKADLQHQAISAVSGHAQGTVTPTDAQLEEIADYEMGVFTAQAWDWKAERLDRGGALGGARNLVLRGLAARAPYFHNGAAATLLDAINFYNQRFQMSLTPRQKQQLVAFLNSL